MKDVDKPMKILVRPCTMDDLAALREFSEAMFLEAFRGTCSQEDMDVYLKEAFHEGKIRSELSNPHSCFFFLYADGILSGYIKLNEAQAQSDLHADDSLELERIYVSGEAQGKGLGSYLMEKAVETARQKGKRYLWLGVWEKNAKALSFYQKHGFYPVGTHVFMIGEDHQTDFIMRRDLS